MLRPFKPAARFPRNHSRCKGEKKKKTRNVYMLLHCALLSFNALLIPVLSWISGGSKSPFAKKENTSALLLVASQKTLPVMVAVVEQLGGALGVSGLLVLPCVAAHLNQIIIDSFLVSLWKPKEGEFEKAKIA